VVAHKNDSKFLKENLPLITSQEYPLYEVIIVDDHSLPEEKESLQEIIQTMKEVQLLETELNGKKSALSTGVYAAQYDMILCTDADCKPAGDQWIRKMVESGKSNEVVLGYSPYQKKPGLLNLFIRYETLMTAIQYMSWALAGKPYMGVGRNMLYPRSLFLTKDPYQSQKDIPYGDDDLFVQMLAGDTRFNVCNDPSAHMISKPALSWSGWMDQKHRHMSAGHFYKKTLWLQPGVYGIALVMHWVLIIFLAAGAYWWKWMPVLLIGLLIRWGNYSVWSRQLIGRDTILWYPLLEIIYAVYLGVMGIYTLFNRRKTWN